MWDKIQGYIIFWFVPCLGALIAVELHEPKSWEDKLAAFVVYAVIFAAYMKVGEVLYDRGLTTFKPRCSQCSVNLVCPTCSSKKHKWLS